MNHKLHRLKDYTEKICAIYVIPLICDSEKKTDSRSEPGMTALRAFQPVIPNSIGNLYFLGIDSGLRRNDGHFYLCPKIVNQKSEIENSK